MGTEPEARSGFCKEDSDKESSPRSARARRHRGRAGVGPASRELPNVAWHRADEIPRDLVSPSNLPSQVPVLDTEKFLGLGGGRQEAASPSDRFVTKSLVLRENEKDEEMQRKVPRTLSQNPCCAEGGGIPFLGETRHVRSTPGR